MGLSRVGLCRVLKLSGYSLGLNGIPTRQGDNGHQRLPLTGTCDLDQGLATVTHTFFLD